MSILDRLLETDAEKLQDREKRQYEIKRLSDLLGEKFTVNCKPMSREQVLHIGEISSQKGDFQTNTVLEACDVEGKKFSSGELLEKFGVVSGKEVVEKLFLPGEISALYDKVNEISGYGENAVEEVKN